MSSYTDSIINKATETTASASDSIMLKVGGLLKWISLTNLATVLGGLITTSQKFKIRTTTISSDAAVASDRIINCVASANAINVAVDPVLFYDSTLLAATPLWINRAYGSLNNITITPTTGTIDGGSYKTISSGGKMVYSDGTNLFTI